MVLIAKNVNVYCVCHNMASYAFLNYFRFRKTDDGYTDNPHITPSHILLLYFLNLEIPKEHDY